MRTAPCSSRGSPPRRAAWRDRHAAISAPGFEGYVTLNAVLVAPVSPGLLAVRV